MKKNIRKKIAGFMIMVMISSVVSNCFVSVAYASEIDGIEDVSEEVSEDVDNDAVLDDSSDLISKEQEETDTSETSDLIEDENNSETESIEITDNDESDVEEDIDEEDIDEEDIDEEDMEELKENDIVDTITEDLPVEDNIGTEEKHIVDETVLGAYGDVEINEKTFPDFYFRKWVSGNVDLDHNGFLSSSERNNRTYVDFDWNKDIKDLTGIKYLQSLKKIKCNDAGIISFDVSGMNSLENIECSCNKQLKSIDFTNCINLREVCCNSNESLASVSIKGCTSLNQAEFSGNNIKELDASGLMNLEFLYCQDCINLSHLNITGCYSLAYLRCDCEEYEDEYESQISKLTSLDITGCKKLIKLVEKTERTGSGWDTYYYYIGYEAELYCNEKVQVTYTKIDPQGIGLNYDSITLQRGESKNIIATVVPEDADDKTVSWSSDNTSVATIDQNGLLKAVATGKANITATTVNGISKTISVKVVVYPKLLVLNSTSETMYFGQKLTLEPYIYPEDATERNITWSISNKDIASVNSGIVKVWGAGIVTVTAKTSNGLTASCTITILCENNPLNPFADVKSGNWKYNAALYAYENGYMNGKGTLAGKILFSPDTAINRSQFVQTLYNVEGKPSVAYIQKFSDVKEGDWYAKPVTWAEQNGIVAGNANGTFGVNGTATREQLAQMFYKYAKYKGYNVDVVSDSGKRVSDFPDADKVSNWAENPLNWALSRGIMSGKGSGKLDPKGSATRAECATMLRNFMNAYKDEIPALKSTLQ